MTPSQTADCVSYPINRLGHVLAARRQNSAINRPQTIASCGGQRPSPGQPVPVRHSAPLPRSLTVRRHILSESEPRAGGRGRRLGNSRPPARHRAAARRRLSALGPAASAAPTPAEPSRVEPSSQYPRRRLARIDRARSVGAGSAQRGTGSAPSRAAREAAHADRAPRGPLCASQAAPSPPDAAAKHTQRVSPCTPWYPSKASYRAAHIGDSTNVGRCSRVATA